MLNASVGNSPVSIELTGENAEFYSTAKLALPLGCEHTIGLAFNKNMSTDIVATSGLYVPEGIRRKGLATKLLKAGFSFAKSSGVYISMSYISSPYALMARRSIFGDDGITICGDDLDIVPMDIRVEDAIIQLGQNKREYGFIVISNLLGIDTAGWGPIEVS
jgi:hypothetical protein